MSGAATPLPAGRTAVALIAAVLLHVAAAAAIAPLSERLGYTPQIRDVGDTFAKLSEVAEYADALLARLASGAGRPEPPRLLGDPGATALAYGLGVAVDLGWAALAIAAAGGLEAARRSFGLQPTPANELWLAGALAVGAWAIVAAWRVAAEVAGATSLASVDRVPEPVFREHVVLALFGLSALVTAPLAEELLFRGLLFRFLRPWGWWLAALGTAIPFALLHGRLATLAPFALVGVLFAWGAERTGRVTDAWLAHALFNGISFIVVLRST